jgi:hypothetical protein
VDSVSPQVRRFFELSGVAELFGLG